MMRVRSVSAALIVALVLLFVTGTALPRRGQHTLPPVTAAHNTASGGDEFAVAIKPNGTLWTCGDNRYGQLGLGDLAIRRVFTRVGGANDWTSLDAGNNHVLALKLDHSLWAWGGNGGGQLGLGDTDPRDVPTRVGEALDWTLLSGGTAFSLATKTDGSLWAWGENEYGQLGLGGGLDRLQPERVGPDDDWAAISAGRSHAAAIKTDGTLWAWGRNNAGQLGLGDTTTRNAPVRVGGEDTWVAVSCGDFDTRALKADGSLWAWGDNAYGQLGVGDLADRTLPTRVGVDADWSRIESGDDHVLAIKTDGSLWAWGDNTFGQLGLGDLEHRLSPIRVGDADDWTSIACGDDYTTAVRGTRVRWVWGDNLYSQLSLGDAVSRDTPEPSMVLTDGGGPAVYAPTSPTHPDPEVWYSDRAPAFDLLAKDQSGVAGYAYVLDRDPTGAAPFGTPNPLTSVVHADRADGLWYFHLRAVDRAGNWYLLTRTRQIRIDATLPSAAVTMPVHGASYALGSDVGCQWTSGDASSGVASALATVDGLPIGLGDSLDGLAPGPHTLWLTVTDNAGNQTTTSVEFTMVDLTVAVAAPNGGESWEQWSRHDVTWTLDAPVSEGSFDVWVGRPGTDWVKVNPLPIAASAATTEYSFDWKIRQPAAEDYSVRVDYMGSGGTIVESDVSDAVFTVTEAPAPPPSAYELVTVGRHAYVAAGSAGLQIYDVADPSAPTLVGECDTLHVASDVAVVGRYAYVADGEAGVTVVDVGDPTEPVVVNSVGLEGPAGRLSLSAGRLLEGFESATGWTAPLGGSLSLGDVHVKEGSSSLKLTVPPSTSARAQRSDLGWDLSQDHSGLAIWVHLKSTGTLPLSPHDVLSLRLYLSNANNLANAFYTGSNFSVHEGWNLLRFSPLDWRELGAPSWSSPIQRIAIDVATPDDRSWEVSFDELVVGTTGLKPAFLWTFDDGYEETWQDVFPYLAALGERATLYVRSDWPGGGGVRITLPHLEELYDAGWAIANHTVDHTDLSQVDQATAEAKIAAGRQWLIDHGFTRTADHLAYPFSATSDAALAAAEVQGALTARAGGSRNQHQPLDTPLMLTSFGFDESTPSLDLWQSRIDKALATGSTMIIYAHAFDSTTLPLFHAIVDYLEANDVWMPTIDEWWGTLAAQSASGETSAGRYLYVACGSAGVQVVDISDPVDPVPIGLAATNGPASDVAPRGSHVAAAVDGAGLDVVDAALPTTPTVAGTSAGDGVAQGVYVRDARAFVASGEAGLRIVDLGNPSAPSTVGSVDTPGDARDVVVVDDYALVADGPSDVQIVDVSDPAAPFIAGSLAVDGEAHGLVAFGGRVYVAAGAGGLQIVALPTP
jgi:alpha-tubulin suppressor-like RCC1 family protein/peptidoglycan/xylan/chitin deacetylase (PgdA/CDA1 family)